MRVSRRFFQLGIVANILGRASAAAREVKSVGEDGWIDLDLRSEPRLSDWPRIRG